MLVLQIPRNLPVFHFHLHWVTRGFQLSTAPTSGSFGSWPLLQQSKARGTWQARGSQQLPQFLLACNGTGHLSLEQLPLPEPLLLTGMKVMPGAFPARLQPLQHHQTSLWVLQEVQRQQQTWLNLRTPQLYLFPCLHHSESPAPTWLYCILINSTQEASTNPFFN